VYSGGTWHAVGGGTNAAVESLAISGGYLYSGGGFTTPGGASTGAPVARWKLGTAPQRPGQHQDQVEQVGHGRGQRRQR